jgi:hypothetical protein
MDFYPTAMPTRFAIGEIHLHVRFNHAFRTYVVHA